ncbi:MAG TPA: SMC-Scp complex subunit ScpB [Candidatus Elarobacter sp.]|jgi:segregation and condensation protein B
MQPELVDTGHLQRTIEALLFVASEALSIKELAKLTGAEQSDVTVALQKIDEEFAQRGIVLREIAGGYRFASSPEAREAVEAYLLPPKTNLSPAALETLAIVAYTQPCTKGEIEEIRGVSADSVIATLLDRRFIAESGRKESPGRPMLYKTTADFLEAFGLRQLDDLPPVEFESGMPVELALPIPTVPASQETPAGDDRVLEADTTESETDEQNSRAPVETTAATPETEPTPSAV